jgi:hypothetical protein
VAGCFAHGNKPSGSKNVEHVLSYCADRELLKKNSAYQSY